MSWELLDWSILGPAIVAGLLVLTTHVPLGIEVLKRGIIFIDLAIAQVAGLGVIAASAFGWEEHGWQVQAAAVGAALVAAAGLNWTERRWPSRQEPLIGILFVLAATGGILLLAQNPHGGEHLKDLLVGQILWSTWPGLAPIAALYAVLLTLWVTLRQRLGQIGFYLTFAFAVTASVQLVGVYLVFASLIIPALAAGALQGRSRIAAAYAIGAASYVLGIALSAMLDLPTGALTVWSMALVGTLAGFAVAGRAQRASA
ncbi:MAG: metal ABC transporter permease [Pseudomonadales bacterium]